VSLHGLEGPPEQDTPHPLGITKILSIISSFNNFIIAYGLSLCPRLILAMGGVGAGNRIGHGVQDERWHQAR